MTSWRPGRRAARRALETPFEDVPDHLVVPLMGWCELFLSQDQLLVRELGVELQIVLPDPGSYGGLASAVERLRKLCIGDRGLLLDVVEYVLEKRCDNRVSRRFWQEAQALDQILLQANSAYKVTASCGGLEMRLMPEVQSQVQAVLDLAGGSSGDHLASAWNEAYSRNPDPVKSYSESIKAVEAALAQHVSPANAVQTLGTMIRDVAAKPSKWEFAIPDGRISGVGTVLHMMEVLWDGQSSRHGGMNPTRAETLEQAQAAVHMAATLVQFGVSGAFSAA